MSNAKWESLPILLKSLLLLAHEGVAARGEVLADLEENHAAQELVTRQRDLVHEAVSVALAGTAAVEELFKVCRLLETDPSLGAETRLAIARALSFCEKSQEGHA